MWFRKKEFKADRSGTSLLSYLYPTAKQRQNLTRWSLVVLVLVVLSLVQDVVMCRLTGLIGTTDLVPGAIFLQVMLLLPEDAAVFALVSSTVYFCGGNSPGVMSIVFITSIGVVFNLFRKAYLRRSVVNTILIAVVMLYLYELLVFALGLFLQRTDVSRISSYLFTATITALFTLAEYPVLRAIQKIGGQQWRD